MQLFNVAYWKPGTWEWDLGMRLLMIELCVCLMYSAGGDSRLWKSKQEAYLEGACYRDHHPRRYKSLHLSSVGGRSCHNLLLHTVWTAECKCVEIKFNEILNYINYSMFYFAVAIIQWYPIWRSGDSGCHNNAQPDSPIPLLLPGSIWAIQDPERGDQDDTCQVRNIYYNELNVK